MAGSFELSFPRFYRRLGRIWLFKNLRHQLADEKSENNFIISTSRPMSPHHSPANLFLRRTLLECFLHVVPNSREHHDQIIISSNESRTAPWKCNGTKSKFIVSLSLRRSDGRWSVGCSASWIVCAARSIDPISARSDRPSLASDIGEEARKTQEEGAWEMTKGLLPSDNKTSFRWSGTSTDKYITSTSNEAQESCLKLKATDGAAQFRCTVSSPIKKCFGPDTSQRYETT